MFGLRILVCTNELCRTAHWIDKKNRVRRINYRAALSPLAIERSEPLPTHFCLGGSEVTIRKCSENGCDHVEIEGLPDGATAYPFTIGRFMKGKAIVRTMCPGCKQRCKVSA